MTQPAGLYPPLQSNARFHCCARYEIVHGDDNSDRAIALPKFSGRDPDHQDEPIAIRLRKRVSLCFASSWDCFNWRKEVSAMRRLTSSPPTIIVYRISVAGWAYTPFPPARISRMPIVKSALIITQ